MAKRKADVPLSEEVDRYLSRIEKAFDEETSSLNKAFLFYEFQAKATLIEAGYMGEQGKWVKGYNADIFAGGAMGFFDDPAHDSYYSEYEKLRPIVQRAVRVLFNVKRCRENVRSGNMEDAVLDMERIVQFSDAVRRLAEASPKGRDRRNKGLVEAVEHVRSRLKGKVTAGTILRQFRTKHNSRENALMTACGFRVYLSADAKGQEGFYIIDKKGNEARRSLAALIKTYLK